MCPFDEILLFHNPAFPRGNLIKIQGSHYRTSFILWADNILSIEFSHFFLQ